MARATPEPTKTTTTTATTGSVSHKNNTMSAKPSSTKRQPSQPGWISFVRALLLEGPVVLLFVLFLCAALLQRVYGTYVVPIVESYKRGPMIDGFYEDYHNEFTYYNRHCGPKDLTTKSANDLLIKEHYSETQAADVMLEHGAVAFQNVLTNDTATELRAYLATLHHDRQTLSYNKVFWDEISRLSLGIGTEDHPAIAKAMEEIGNHAVLKRTLEGILGPDPSIVEISTLTSLNGADDQGIHTDSDWFGSSLLYGRSFLHSYSMFVALQDTSKDLGATTVCPGSHYCADQDLEELCLNHGAFEVSTNGHTGSDGVLRKGDAFLFNQNIWHRGPRNVDPDGLDRIMFIMTFATAKDDPSDRRIQGLGTYYYQRFNMWGSTFSMLKHATTTMIQPLAGLRALGLIRTRGVTWIHQFAQQLANGEEFYDDHELDDFVEKILDHYNVPKFLRSESDQWQAFIPEMISISVEFIGALNVAAFLVYCIGSALAKAVSPQQTRLRMSIARLLFLITLTAGMMAALSSYIDTTDLAQSVTTGEVFGAPFPEPQMTANHEAPLTFPERNDVLISTRYDAKFLASFNRFLSFHPGNRRWESMVSASAPLPDNLVQPAANNIVNSILQTREEGHASRFLLQQPQTGSWIILSEEDALKETLEAIAGIQNPLIGSLSREGKYLLADARFGQLRETAMARMSEAWLMTKWPSILYGEKGSRAGGKPTVTSSTEFQQFKIGQAFSHLNIQRHEQSWFGSRRSASDFVKEALDDDVNPYDTRLGDKVWVGYGPGQWYEGKLVNILEGDEACVVYVFNSGTYEEIETDYVRKYISFQVGDRVEVDYDGNLEEFFPGTITSIHPDGKCSVLFDDGEVGNGIGREYMELLPPVGFSEDDGEEEDDS